MAGRPPLGDVPASGVFAPQEKPATATLAEWQATAAQRNAEIISDVGPTGDKELDRKAWDKTKKEIEMGYIVWAPSKSRNCDLGTMGLHPRWAKWENTENGTWKARNLTDLKASGANSTVQMHERYNPEDLSMAHSAIRILKQLFGPQTALAGWRIDWEMAFKQSPIKPQLAKWMQEVFWNPEVNRVQRLIPRDSCFGGKAAQYNFVHEVHFVVHVARAVFGILAANYSDDMWAIEPMWSATSSWQCMCAIMDTLGWRYDKRKSPPPTSNFRLLGVIFTLDIENFIRQVAS